MMFRTLIPLNLLLAISIAPSQINANEAGDTSPVALLDRFCADCHGDDDAEAGVNLQSLNRRSSFADDFRDWQRVVAQLQTGTMPPADATQPTRLERQLLVDTVRHRINVAAQKHAGDPGPVVMRRLTSAEYAYSVGDLTGLDLGLDRGFGGDAVGGAGFTNTGIAQFMQDSTLERYLDAGRLIADHAVIGSGPLTFFRDPGQTGLELSAISRINSIYREHGFRTAAGEGGQAFGMEKYPDAFFVAWLFQHRQRLGADDVSLETLARRAGVSVRFARYVDTILQSDSHPFPLSDLVERWQRLPVAERDNAALLKSVRTECGVIAAEMLSWQNRFGENPDAKEEAPVLSERSFDVSRTKDFVMNINWPKGTKTAHLVLSIESANRDGTPDAVVIWKNPEVQFRIEDEVLEDPKPLTQFLDADATQRLAFGSHPRGGKVSPQDFVTIGTRPPAFELPIVPRARSARMFVTAELDIQHGEDCIVRCTIAQLEETDQGKSVSGLLANPRSQAFEKWQSGVRHFARMMPQVSQREPAPSDRDPIPSPFDTSYNNAERNYYHTHIKYHRDDAFLVDNMLDDSTRQQLDSAWADLLGSFEFHALWLQFISKKYGIDLAGRDIERIDDEWLQSLPDEPRQFLSRLHAEHAQLQKQFHAAQSGHVDDVIALATRAWRRPLTDSEDVGLRSFYRSLHDSQKLSHDAALRAAIARVFVAPAFLYRMERHSDATPGRPLNDWELASRLSYFLWSSPPDEQLRRAAAQGKLSSEEEVVQQARRMLADPRARRFAAEFFGQWFGFYRFDQYRGIDPQRFPEFTDSIRNAMHNEAVTFFTHIVRQDRPVNEILFADYTWLSEELAGFYGVSLESVATASAGVNASDGAARRHGVFRIERASDVHRGGLLRLGAVLAVTSAPLRTSPVKRGDWILRRVLGTAVPPPPADAGSIAADDVVDDGTSIRARLEAHRRDASCRNCHARIDPLGFALEHFDPLGRWRDEYRDGNSIEPTGVLRSGRQITGDEGLHRYLKSQQSSFHQTLCRKLLAYSLGRQELVGDLPLLDAMAGDLEAGGRLSQLVERVVTSRQFRFRGTSE